MKLSLAPQSIRVEKGEDERDGIETETKKDEDEIWVYAQRVAEPNALSRFGSQAHFPGTRQEAQRGSRRMER